MMPPPPPDDDPLPGHLPRLADSAYRGKAIVHWTLTVRDHGTGWLDARFTTRFRWLMLHGCGRYEVACPVHCLMPDHVHLLLHGWSQQGDQRGFIRFLRRHSSALLAESGHQWQPQPHDHVLRPQESDRQAYETLANYIAQNPVRAGLVKEAQDWPHTGAIIPGYPELKLWQHDDLRAVFEVRAFRQLDRVVDDRGRDAHAGKNKVPRRSCNRALGARPLLDPIQPEVREYQIRCWENGQPVGEWTPVQKITVSPM